MDNKSIETISEGKGRVGLTYGQMMNRIWWMGTVCGVYSLLFAWWCYTKYANFFNRIPTLLALAILIGLFGCMSFCLKNATFYLFDTVKEYAKKILKGILFALGIEISCISRKVLDFELKINLIKFGSFGLAAVLYKHFS